MEMWIDMKNEFHAQLRRQGWNTQPKNKFAIPSSKNPLVNAARAIAVSAYPNPHYHVRGGKAEKYSVALLAYISRTSRLMDEVDSLPPWVTNIRVDSMERHLSTGRWNLMRALTIRDLINSAVVMKSQHNHHLNGEKTTFTMQYLPDLSGMNIKVPIEKTVSGYILSGCIPDTKLASLRAAILYHRPALERFQGPAVTEDGPDSEGDYQNVYNRHVRPALFAQHIVQVVWEQTMNFLDEANERDIAIDQILMRKAEWASDIQIKTAKGLGTAIFRMRQLGVSSCWCEMVRFADPLPDS